MSFRATWQIAEATEKSGVCMWSQQQNRKKEMYARSSCNFSGRFVSCHASRAARPLHPVGHLPAVPRGFWVSLVDGGGLEGHALKHGSVPTLPQEPRSLPAAATSPHSMVLPLLVSFEKITVLGASSQSFLPYVPSGGCVPFPGHAFVA